MFGNFGLGVVLVGIVCYFAIVILPIWRICTKAGYSGLVSLIFLIPLINFLALFYFAFTEWPIERRLKEQEFQL